MIHIKKIKKLTNKLIFDNMKYPYMLIYIPPELHFSVLEFMQSKDYIHTEHIKEQTIILNGLPKNIIMFCDCSDINIFEIEELIHLQDFKNNKKGVRI